MPFKIQRTPRGLNEMLGIFGGATPIELEDRVRPSLDLLQMYGLAQRQILQAQGVIAEGASVSLVTPPTSWSVLFGGSCTVTKTATMTACEISILLIRGTAGINVAARNFTPFGATETGLVSVTFWAPYPILMPPGSVFAGSLVILGTDATATVNCSAEIGVVG